MLVLQKYRKESSIFFESNCEVEPHSLLSFKSLNHFNGELRHPKAHRKCVNIVSSLNCYFSPAAMYVCNGSKSIAKYPNLESKILFILQHHTQEQALDCMAVTFYDKSDLDAMLSQ